MPAPNFQNRTLFHSDNLPILQGMNSETVDLIATDPPFNKGRDFHATPDSLSAGARFQDRWSWERDVHETWTDAIKDDYPAVWSVIDFARATYGDDMGAFLCFMGVRLMEMRRILKPTGSCYLHCDPTASHYLKALMDAIFGRQNFRNEIVWSYNKWANHATRFQSNHDIILSYSRGTHPTFHRQYDDPTRRQIELRKSGYNKGTRTDGTPILRVYDKEKASGAIEQAQQEGRIIYHIDKPLVGKMMSDVWSISALNGRAAERVGYPTQKPLALYERIVKASSNPGDMVLDPFAGCATTVIAAERLGRQWVGIDLWDGAHEIVRRRMEDNRQLLADPDPIIHYTIEPPIRTDEGDTAPDFEIQLRVQRTVEPWQKLTHAEIRAILEEAQCLSGMQPGLVVCAGCGITLPARHFELDHVNPRAQGGENWITNRVLICGPCNRRKRHELTLVGLQRENKREKNMENENAAKEAWDRARIAASRRRDNLS